MTRMRRLWAGFGLAVATATGALAQTAAPTMMDQGPLWSDVDRQDFYTRDQGSRIMPLPWLLALKQPDGDAFVDGLLARYGYLPNPSDKRGMPIGFTVSGPKGAEVVGMTCAACHTRQIIVKEQPYRIDGGPALADFQGFVGDLDLAVGAVLKDDASFTAFSDAAEAAGAPAPVQRADVVAWYNRYHALMSIALKTASPWGRGRLDALGMIFNRLTGLDLGPADRAGVITANIHPADAPVRYPFLWNAPRQDFTQWPGVAPNGDDFLALGRNLGQVYGVFGEFAPRPSLIPTPLNVDYLRGNSANFDGLSAAEDLIRRIGPPKWPWPADAALVAKGREVFGRDNDKGGCVGCHGIQTGAQRASPVPTWKTLLIDTGTDSREYASLGSDTATGNLAGAFVPFTGLPLGTTDKRARILQVAVIGTLIQHYVEALAPFSADIRRLAESQGLFGTEGFLQAPPLPPQILALASTFTVPPPPADGSGPIRYESRVMQGIWAAAPYLHNGSVPSLAELLKHPADRVTSFEVGPAYDIDAVGLATQQGPGATMMTTTSCADRNSGNSNCGHDFGTDLPPEDKRALIEYLKTL